jgi:uroporphyrinogen-III synthase
LAARLRAGARRRQTDRDAERRAEAGRERALPRRARPEGTIEAALESDFALEIVEAYAAEAREAWSPAETRALASCVAALHYSRRSAGLAAALAKDSGAEARFLGLAHVCLSRDVAEPLAAAGAAGIAIAETADEAGLFRALSRSLGGFPSLGASRI